jgi:hypothetical protein
MTAPAKVKVPGIGQMDKRLVIGGVAAAAGLGVYAYRKNQQAAASTPAPSQIDPATGEPYGSAQDAAALQAQSDFISPGGGGGGGSGASTLPQTSQGFTSNSQWSQAAQDYLVANTGGDAGVIGAALGVYIGGQPATAAQKTIIEQAIAFQGLPPVAGLAGFPPSIRDAAAPAPQPTPVVAKALATPHLYILKYYTSNAMLGWDPVPHAAFYRVTRSPLSPIVTTGTRLVVPRHDSYGVTAYPAGYTHGGYRTDLKSPYLRSAESAIRKVN